MEDNISVKEDVIKLTAEKSCEGFLLATAL
jgi:hypothetical protein